jgi:hypothetical protein
MNVGNDIGQKMGRTALSIVLNELFFKGLLIHGLTCRLKVEGLDMSGRIVPAGSQPWKTINGKLYFR